MTTDWIQAAVAARAEERGMTAYGIAILTGLNPQTVKRFIAGRCALNSRYVSMICDVLGLVLKPGKRGTKKKHEDVTSISIRPSGESA